MSKTTLYARICSIGAFTLLLAGCPAGDDGNADTTGETGEGETEGFVCDPAGANPEMGALLNAPVADDVEVIVKDPQHPGQPGPENLP